MQMLEEILAPTAVHNSPTRTVNWRHSIGRWFQADALKAYDESTTLFDRLLREVLFAKKHEYLYGSRGRLGEQGELQSESKNMNAAAFDLLRR